MLKVEELHRNTEFQDWLHNVHRGYLKGNPPALTVVKNFKEDIEEIRAWVKRDSPRHVQVFCWQLIKDVIRYRMRRDCPWPYAVPDTEEDLPDVYTDALLVVTGARNKDYGRVWTNFNDIATLIRETGGNPNQTPVDVALDIMCVKVGRLMHTPDHYDSMVDLIGYVFCLFQLFDYMESAKANANDTEKIEKPKEGLNG